MAKRSAWAWGIGVVGVPVAVVAVVLAARWEPMQAAKELPRAEARYKALGLPLTQADLPVAHWPSEQNAVTALKRATDALGKSSYRTDLDKALLTGDTELIREALEPFQIALDEVPNILNKRGLDYARDWDQGSTLLFPQFAEIKSLIRVIAASARLHALEGKSDQALRELSQIFLLAEMLNDEPTLISGLVQVSIHAIAYRTYQDCFAVWHSSPAILAKAQAQLQREKSRIDFLKSMKMEAYMGLTMYRNLKAYHPERLKQPNPDGDIRTLEDAFEMETVTRRSGMPESMMARAFMTRHLNYWSSFFEYAKANPNNLRGFGEEMGRLTSVIASQSGASYDPIKELGPVFDQASMAYIRLEASRLTTQELARCLEVHAKTGRYPTASSEIDPFIGKPLRIKVKGSEIRVYSLGQNGRDDGALSRSEEATVPGRPQSERDDVVAQYPPLEPATKKFD